MKNVTRNRERGVALFFSIFALLLLTAIAGALIFMASTETSINSNYRQEQTAFFAAKAGIEEARARMMLGDPNSINTTAAPLPIVAPTTTNTSLIYIVNPVTGGTAVQPWNSGNQWADDELCHDGYALGLTPAAPGVRCATATLGATAYVSVNSQLPYSGTATPVPYKWVRVAPKLNGSLMGPGTTATNPPVYDVNAVGAAATPVCWDGVNEWVLTLANCQAMANLNTTYMTNVYTITSLGVSSDAANAARKVLQAEVALNPTPPFVYGLFATSTSCSPPALSLSGQPTTDSYTTAGNGTYATTQSNFGGDIGSNGGVNIDNGSVGGAVGVVPTACSGTPFQTGPNGTDVVPDGTPGPPACTLTTGCTSKKGSGVGTSVGTAPVTFPIPPTPNPAPPNTTCSTGPCTGTGTLVPGTYGNISVPAGATITLAPGTYNINSLSMSSNPNTQIVVNPAGAVTLNVAGTGQTTPIDIEGNGLINNTNPNDFLINYGGSGNIKIAGNGSATAILNAPNAAIAQKGNGTWFGAILGSTIQLTGNAFFHYDRASALAPANNGYYTLISFREVAY